MTCAATFAAELVGDPKGPMQLIRCGSRFVRETGFHVFLFRQCRSLGPRNDDPIATANHESQVLLRLRDVCAELSSTVADEDAVSPSVKLLVRAHSLITATIPGEPAASLGQSEASAAGVCTANGAADPLIGG
jgi:hypothetical protein